MEWTPAKRETLIRSAFEVSVAIEEVPLKVSDDGTIRFSKKTQVGTVAFSHKASCLIDIYKKIQDSKILISGKLSQGESTKLTGEMEIKIITPENDYYILHYKEMTPYSTDKGDINRYL